MANYQNLKAAISAAIRTNGNQEITGQVLQDVLNSIVSVIGANYTFAGVATPATNPGTPDQNVMYLAMEGGTYTNFNGTVLPAGISLLMWNGSWTSETVMYGDGGVFDISVYKSSGGTLATFADLAAALDGGNNIPASARKGGMSVKYVQSSDNKYVQYRLTSTTFSIDETNWEIEVSIEDVERVKQKGNNFYSDFSAAVINVTANQEFAYQIEIPFFANHHYFISAYGDDLLFSTYLVLKDENLQDLGVTFDQNSNVIFTPSSNTKVVVYRNASQVLQSGELNIIAFDVDSAFNPYKSLQNQQDISNIVTQVANKCFVGVDNANRIPIRLKKGDKITFGVYSTDVNLSSTFLVRLYKFDGSSIAITDNTINTSKDILVTDDYDYLYYTLSASVIQTEGYLYCRIQNSSNIDNKIKQLEGNGRSFLLYSLANGLVYNPFNTILGHKYRISLVPDNIQNSNAPSNAAIFVIDKYSNNTWSTQLVERKEFGLLAEYEFVSDVEQYRVGIYLNSGKDAVISVNDITLTSDVRTQAIDNNKRINFIESILPTVNEPVILDSGNFKNEVTIASNGYPSPGSRSAYLEYIPILSDTVITANDEINVAVYSEPRQSTFIKFIPNSFDTKSIVISPLDGNYCRIAFKSQNISWEELGLTIVRKKAQNLVESFFLRGNGSNIVNKDITLQLGHRYKLTVPKQWDWSNISTNDAIFSIDKYLDNASQNLFVVRAFSKWTAVNYEIVAKENDYYRLNIRAKSGEIIQFTLEDITYTQKEDNRYHRDLDTHGWVLNDGYVYTAFSAPHLNIEPTKGIGYVTGLASKTSYTEAGGDLILAVFPCVQPYNIEYFSVAKTGDIDINGNSLSGVPYDMCSMSFYDANNIFIIRSFFVDFNGYNLYYRDFNTNTKTFVSAPVKVQYYNSNNELADVTDVAMTAYVESLGGSWNGPQKTIFTNHIINDKTLWDDGDYIYSVITAAGPGNPIVVKSNDNFATIHLVTILPQADATAETAIARLNGKTYILYRKISGIWFQTTNDFETYSECVWIPSSIGQRPEILVQNEQVFLFVPTIDNVDSFTGERTAYHLYKGVGDDFGQYSDELFFTNDFGMVYASAKFFNGRLLIAYSTNLLMLGNNKSGKSTMIFDIVKDYYQ